MGAAHAPFVTSVAKPGDVLAHQEVHISKQPSNGETESLSCACTVPYREDEDGLPKPSLALASLSLSVEDWGRGVITNSAGDEVVIDCTAAREEPGARGGHPVWGGCARLVCGPGAVSLSASASNIVMKNPKYNLFVFDCTMKVVFLESGGQDMDEEPCVCRSCSMEGGTPPSAVRSFGQAAGFSSSSSGSSVVATTTENKMYWSCSTGNLRGLGARLAGKVQLVAQELGRSRQTFYSCNSTTPWRRTWLSRRVVWCRECAFLW